LKDTEGIKVQKRGRIAFIAGNYKKKGGVFRLIIW
jgi:hypothetical protein